MLQSFISIYKMDVYCFCSKIIEKKDKNFFNILENKFKKKIKPTLILLSLLKIYLKIEIFKKIQIINQLLAGSID